MKHMTIKHTIEIPLPVTKKFQILFKRVKQIKDELIQNDVTDLILVFTNLECLRRCT
jgi:hypothetical protein